MTRRFQLAPMLTSDAQTSAGNAVTLYRANYELRRGIQVVMDIAPLIIVGLVVAFLFVSALR